MPETRDQIQVFKSTSMEVASYERAARASGLNKSQWIRVVLAVAAGIPLPTEERIAEMPSRGPGALEALLVKTQTFNASTSETQAYAVAAKAVGLKAGPWIRLILASASGVYDLPAQMARVANIQVKPVQDGEW